MTPVVDKPAIPPETPTIALGVSDTFIGECSKCHGPLCVGTSMEGAKVKCERCGAIILDHPLTREKVVKQTPKEIVCKPEDFPATVPERTARLEKLVASQAARLDRLESKLQERSQKQAK